MKTFLQRAAEFESLSYQDLHIILDALPVPLSWATLPGGEITFVNRAFTKTFGYEEGAFANVSEWIDRTYVQDHQRQQARQVWREMWEAPSTGITEIEPFEIAILCSDNSIRTVQHRGILLNEMGIGIAVFDDISHRREAEEALRRVAFEDPLTGLGNRRVLQEMWGQAILGGAGIENMVAILLIDLDHFKAVNDQLGHDAGDETLVTVAGRLKKSIRGGDLACRMGGDEFAILLPGLRSPDPVERICQRISTALRRPIRLHGQTAAIGGSIGASLYPQDGTKLEVLLKRADEALYRRKAERTGGWEWYKAPAAACPRPTFVSRCN